MNMKDVMKAFVYVLVLTTLVNTILLLIGWNLLVACLPAGTLPWLDPFGAVGLYIVAAVLRGEGLTVNK